MNRKKLFDQISRRRVLKGTGTAAVVGAVGGTQFAAAAEGGGETGFVVAQGDTCTEVTPLAADEDIVEAYGYVGSTEVENPRQPNLPSPLEETQTSRLFLYDGPEGLSLVFIQGGEDDPGGSASVLVCGLPVEGEWAVLDDSYDGATDEFLIGHQEAVLHWAWGASGRNDGAAFRGLERKEEDEKKEFCVSVKSVFGEDAKLDPFGDGDGITDWQFLSGDIDDPEVIDLDLEEPVTVYTGTCPDDHDEENHSKDDHDKCAMDTEVIEEPFEAEVTFCCTTAMITADEYDQVRLNFLNGTAERFDGPFEGTEGFRATDDGDTNKREDIIRSLTIESEGERATVENPSFERCRDLVEQAEPETDEEEPSGS